MAQQDGLGQFFEDQSADLTRTVAAIRAGEQSLGNELDDALVSAFGEIMLKDAAVAHRTKTTFERLQRFVKPGSIVTFVINQFEPQLHGCSGFGGSLTTTHDRHETVVSTRAESELWCDPVDRIQLSFAGSVAQVVRRGPVSRGRSEYTVSTEEMSGDVFFNLSETGHELRVDEQTKRLFVPVFDLANQPAHPLEELSPEVVQETSTPGVIPALGILDDVQVSSWLDSRGWGTYPDLELAILETRAPVLGVPKIGEGLADRLHYAYSELLSSIEECGDTIATKGRQMTEHELAIYSLKEAIRKADETMLGLRRRSQRIEWLLRNNEQPD